jgi:outer membrane protein assembly factor BamB/predicted phosphodiesterase
MKKLLVLLLIISAASASAQLKPFRFAFISDTHIGSPNGGAEEDLRRTVRDINSMQDVAFVVITGDITELGMNSELKLAKQLFDSLRIPYYIMPGNHDTGWSESGGVAFETIFGYDKFHFTYNGIHFLGCPSGPYVRMSDGHIPRDAVNWLDKELKTIKDDEPLFFLNHYPLDPGLDNWYEATSRLMKKNTLAALCGHGHANKQWSVDGIPAIMCRSNLRAKANEGGYTIVDVQTDSVFFSERKPVQQTTRKWAAIAANHPAYNSKAIEFPSYKINDSFPGVKKKWLYSSAANVISTPATINNLVVFGNSLGEVEALSYSTGKLQWKYNTGGSIFSSPAVSGNKLVVGSGDGYVYCVSSSGRLIWRHKTEAAVLGSPAIENNVVYIGGSDHSFRAIDLNTGKLKWAFKQLDGPVVSTPVIAGDKLIFGAWDRNLYALNKQSGKLIWSWNNGSPIRNFSPAACIPVIKDSIVFVVAPDRYITAISLNTGATLWRNNDATMRESIGISADKQWIYGKTMNDEIVAYPAVAEKSFVSWKVNCKFGYEHVPSMLIEKAGNVFFGTKSGVVYAISPNTKERLWAHKIDNSMVNTVNVIDAKHVVAATMDGKVTLLEVK